MGMWGRTLYENDIALDMKDSIDDALVVGNDDTIVNSILAMLKNEYDDCDGKSIAWIVAADRLLKRGAVNVSALYESILNGAEPLADETIDSIEDMIRNKSLRKRFTRARKRYITDWKMGDIYVYSVDAQYTDSAEFAGRTLGFLCVGYYAYCGKHPIVYTFRTTCSPEDIATNPQLIFTHGEFWKMSEWYKTKYIYRGMLWSECEDHIPKDRLHYCANTDMRPRIQNEFVVCDPASYPRIQWDEIESSLLRTKALM